MSATTTATLAMPRPGSPVSAPRPWAEARAWHTNAALLVIGVALILLSHQFLAEYDEFWIGFDGCSSMMSVLYLAAGWMVMTRPVDRFTFPIILTVAIACRLVTLFGEPFLSSDIYRYVWDGVVQHAHISPYRFVPGDPALAFLREPNLEVFNNMNRRDYAHTIYPPAAQAIFYLVTFFSPTVTGMKTFMLLFEGLTVWGLVKLLAHLGYRREQVLLYAWCPMLIWEIGGAGHLDAAAMAFITLALLFRFRHRPVLTGLFLGLAVITKLYPLILFPALYRWGEGRVPDWKMPGSLAAVIVTGYAAYASVGALVFGFLGGYVKEEGLATGARFFLLELAGHVAGLHGVPTVAFYVFCGIVFSGIIFWAWKTCCRRERHHEAPARRSIRAFRLNRSDFLQGPASFLPPAYALAAVLMFLFSPHYAWYIAWLFPFFTLMPSLPMATYLMGFFYGYTTGLADPGPKMYLLNQRLYGATAIAFALHMALKAWTPYRANFLAHRHPEFAATPMHVLEATPEPTR